MARTSRLIHAGRFFARLDRFTCECPRCGYLIAADWNGVARGLSRGGRPERARKSTYNPISSRITCPACRKSFGAGLLLYEIAPRTHASQPADQTPTWKQLLTMREQGGGWLMPQEVRGADELNVYVLADCLCQPKPGGLNMACPVHGWDATNARLDELQGHPPSHPFSPPDDDPE